MGTILATQSWPRAHRQLPGTSPGSAAMCTGTRYTELNFHPCKYSQTTLLNSGPTEGRKHHLQPSRHVSTSPLSPVRLHQAKEQATQYVCMHKCVHYGGGWATPGSVGAYFWVCAQAAPLTVLTGPSVLLGSKLRSATCRASVPSLGYLPAPLSHFSLKISSLVATVLLCVSGFVPHSRHPGKVGAR